MQAVFQREVAAEAYDELQRSTSSPLPTSPRGKRQTHMMIVVRRKQTWTGHHATALLRRRAA